jgi:hypothetical protein
MIHLPLLLMKPRSTRENHLTMIPSTARNQNKTIQHPTKTIKHLQQEKTREIARPHRDRGAPGSFKTRSGCNAGSEDCCTKFKIEIAGPGYSPSLYTLEVHRTTPPRCLNWKHRLIRIKSIQLIFGTHILSSIWVAFGSSKSWDNNWQMYCQRTH